MREGARVAAPFAFLKFCARNPAECAMDGPHVSARETGDTLWRDLESVNASVNRKIAPKNDVAGRDLWELAPNQGDCEDYALTKRSRLIAKGWSPRILTLAIAMAPGYGPHVVLVARTSSGDYLLDNLVSEIRPWHQANYYFISRQSTDNPRHWISVEENNLRASM
ncbi:transglutaminase-like cysteine peptidase [Agaricicola taiwanensis]|nr:transglutaminase-like cysteine peptidase [Agaricicola taiwanensis]